MSAEENKAIVRRHFDEVWNKGNLAIVDEIYAPDISYQGDHVARDEWKDLLSPWRIGLPDFAITRTSSSPRERSSRRTHA
jgi:hypothetical protein